MIMQSIHFLPQRLLLVAVVLLAAQPVCGYGGVRRWRSSPADATGGAGGRRFVVQSLNPFDKRQFDGLACDGTYRRATFARLDAVCDDCFQLYKEPEIHSLCR